MVIFDVKNIEKEELRVKKEKERDTKFDAMKKEFDSMSHRYLIIRTENYKIVCVSPLKNMDSAIRYAENMHDYYKDKVRKCDCQVWDMKEGILIHISEF